MMSWRFAFDMSAMMPTPQASCSRAGSNRPCAGGRPFSQPAGGTVLRARAREIAPFRSLAATFTASMSMPSLSCLTTFAPTLTDEIEGTVA